MSVSTGSTVKLADGVDLPTRLRYMNSLGQNFARQMRKRGEIHQFTVYYHRRLRFCGIFIWNSHKTQSCWPLAVINGHHVLVSSSGALVAQRGYPLSQAKGGIHPFDELGNCYAVELLEANTQKEMIPLINQRLVAVVS